MSDLSRRQRFVLRTLVLLIIVALLMAFGLLKRDASVVHSAPQLALLDR
jgi:hypothetical protein